MLLVAFLLAPIALAGDPIVSVGTEVVMPLGGGWARAFPADEGWNLLFAAGGDYNVLPMTDALTINDRDRRGIIGRTDLKDHAIARCPDGSFLHVGSANLHVDNDSAYADRLDESFNRVASGTVEEGNSARQHNDPALICAPVGEGVMYMDKQGQATATLFEIDGSAVMTGTRNLDGTPRVMGIGANILDASRESGDVVGCPPRFAMPFLPPLGTISPLGFPVI